MRVAWRMCMDMKDEIWSKTQVGKSKKLGAKKGVLICESCRAFVVLNVFVHILNTELVHYS